jgi:hypothetical protein
MNHQVQLEQLAPNCFSKATTDSLNGAIQLDRVSLFRFVLILSHHGAFLFTVALLQFVL